MPSVAVVLGAGGVVGAAYHSGVLTALAEAGFDARQADLLVGTSAGSAIAATLRAGFPPIDLAPRTLGQPVSAEAAAIVGRTGGPPAIDFRPRPLSRVPLPSSPGLLLKAARHPAKAFAGLMPTGTIPTDVIGERINLLYRGALWPNRPLWICAVDLGTGDRVVFGRDELTNTSRSSSTTTSSSTSSTSSISNIPIGTAVQASSSIPGFFRPVEHDGRRFVDGGVHSPTNADLAADGGFDIVVVVSPMSAITAAQTSGRPSARPLHARQLANEIKRLRASGTQVLTFQPTRADVAVMGRNAMDASRREATTETALASTRTRLADPAVAERLDTLRSTA